MLLSIFMISCSNCPSQGLLKVPEKVDDGIAVASLESAGIDSLLIAEAVDKISCGKFNEVHSMLIYKDDKLVLEKYFKGHKFKWDAKDYYGEEVFWNRSMRHSMMSCTKSFTSACIGIAIDKGFIKSVHQSIFDYLPDHQQFKINNREYITIEHLLTMTSGLSWNEWGAAHGTSANDIDMLYFDCDDPISCVLDRPWMMAPGKKFTYNGGGMVILAEILKNATGMDMEAFALAYLFEPIGIMGAEWNRYPNGMLDAAGSLKITPRDMLKLGITYLNNGLWHEKRIISSEWVANSSRIYGPNAGIKIPMEDSGKNGYAYTWWINEFSYSGKTIKMFRAGGWGGQEIMVFPVLDMVVVFTGGNYANSTSLFHLVENYILPSVN